MNLKTRILQGCGVCGFRLLEVDVDRGYHFMVRVGTNVKRTKEMFKNTVGQFSELGSELKPLFDTLHIGWSRPRKTLFRRRNRHSLYHWLNNYCRIGKVGQAFWLSLEDSQAGSLCTY